MGGAFIGIGEGAAGHLFQPAAFTTRAWHARSKRFDWDIASGSLSHQTAKSANESSDVMIRRRFSQGGLNLKWNEMGFGLHMTQRTLIFKHQGSTDSPEASIKRRSTGFGFARTQARGVWHWGVVANLSGFSLDDRELTPEGGYSAGQRLVGSDSAAVIAGALWTPLHQPYRVGLKLVGPLFSTAPTGSPDAAQIDFMPESLRAPVQLGLGASYQWGPRPFNQLPKPGQPARLTPSQRRHLLVAADLVVTAPTHNSLDPAGYLKNKRIKVGSDASWSLRVGAESEIIPDRLVVRGGSYYEPCRRLDCKGKWHATGGMELHIRALLDLRLGVVVDVASDYQNAGLGVGIWH
jgi:hypothetical protein